ncbi:MAG: four helix bundle protein [Deltaproteobacteria bacterium]|nr:MAG: four helix bundle protein [Deltaproteobacteria bacterium]
MVDKRSASTNKGKVKFTGKKDRTRGQDHGRGHADYPVIKAMYRLALEYTERVKSFPRDTRFILGDRILNNCYDILEGLIEARYTKEKERVLRRLNLQLEKLRFQTRFCLDVKVLSAKKYGHICEMINDVGKMIGGWLKSLR